MAPRRKKPPKTPGPPAPVDPSLLPLNDDEQRFVDEFLIDRNASRAYRTTFPNTSWANARMGGSRLSRLPHIQREIRAAIHAQRIRNQVTADNALEEIARIAFSDVYGLYDPDTGLLTHPRHIPYEVRKAIASIRVSRERRSVRTETSGRTRTRTTVSENIVEYKLWNKLDALGKICRHLGLDTEITPIEALLRALPAELSAQVRAVLSEDRSVAAPAPSTNGHASAAPK